MAIDTARNTALKILYDVNQEEAYSNVSINRHLNETNLRVIDRAFITELVYGTLKWKLTIDYIIENFSNIKLKKLSPWILNIMRMGIYQIIYMDKIPVSAACNESVKLAKRYGHDASSRFVNGLLRNVVRNRENVLDLEEGADTVSYLSIKYSHPEWIVGMWLERFGREFTESLLAASNEQPDFSVRVNTLKATRDGLMEILNASGVHTVKGKYADEAVILKNPSSIVELGAFKEGLMQVQDESSMLVGRVASPKPGQLVVDVCSAPGGKATHLAQIMGNKGRIIARDIHEHKINLINEASKRLGTNIIETQMFDALTIDNELVGKADCVLVDAPCTGLGIIRRKPDIKWTRKSSDAGEITKLQKSILNAASAYVKPGGTLVYSTCTIARDENEEMLFDFLNNNREFVPADLSSYIPSALNIKEAGNGYMQLFPNINSTDGFFVSRMIRKI